MKNEPIIRRLERTVAENPNDYTSLFKLGVLYYENDDMQKAIFCLEKSISLQPIFPTARYLLSMSYARTGGYQYAVRELRNVVDEDGDLSFHDVDMSQISFIQSTIKAWELFEEKEPPSPVSYFSLGLFYHSLGSLSRSVNFFEQCAQLHSSFSGINYHLGVVHYDNGDYQQAYEYFNRDISARPQYANSYYYMGVVANQMGNMAQAISFFQNAIRLKPRYIKANLQLVATYIKQADYKQAEKFAKILLSYKPGYPPVLLELGTIFHRQYRMEDAAAYYQRALDADHTSKEATFKLGEINKSLGKMDDAVSFFQKAMQQDPGDSDIYFNIGSIYIKQKKFEQAEEEFKNCLSLDPKNTYAIYSLGETYFEQDKLDKALATYRHGMEVAPKDTKFMNAAGKTLFQMNRPDLAIEEFKRVLQENSTDAYAHYYLGLALFKSGKISDAASEYKRSVDSNPHSAYGHFCLGAAFSLGKEFESAETEFQKAMELTPKSDDELALYGTLQLLASIGISHARQGQELEKSLHIIRNVYRETVKALANAIDARDPYTRFHSVRVSRIAKELAMHIRTINPELLTEEDVEVIEIGGLLHDVGKIAIPDYIVRKESALTDAEFAYMRRHPVEGQRILQDINFPWDIIPIVRYHHEKLNGKGYPDGLSGDQIPLGAMIVCIADVYDALVTDRPYRKAYSTEKAVKIIEQGRGTEFSSGIVTTFLEIVPRLNSILSDIIQRQI